MLQDGEELPTDEVHQVMKAYNPATGKACTLKFFGDAGPTSGIIDPTIQPVTTAYDALALTALTGSSNFVGCQGIAVGHDHEDGTPAVLLDDFEGVPAVKGIKMFDEKMGLGPWPGLTEPMAGRPLVSMQ